MNSTLLVRCPSKLIQEKLTDVLSASTDSDHNVSSIDDQFEQFMSELYERSRFELYAYCALYVIGGIANLYVLTNLVRYGQSNRMNYLLKHLTIADSIVILVTISIEIIWRITVRWPWGNLMCKISMLVRPFGLYLTSCILIAINVDRYFAFVKPLDTEWQDRNRSMLMWSYIISVALCVPQWLVFHVDYHPLFEHRFAQCQTFGSFPNVYLEQLYTIGTAVAIYFVPLAFIVFCYGAIIRSFHQSHRQPVLQESSNSSTPRDAIMQRATYRALRAASAIVITFMLCWTPYVAVLMWEQLDPSSLNQMLTDRQRDMLYCFAVTNSASNPFVHSWHLFARIFGKKIDRSNATRSRPSFRDHTAITQV